MATDGAPPVERRRKSDRNFARLALPLALVCLLPTLVGLWVLDRQNDKIAAQAYTVKAQQIALKKQQAATAAQARENQAALKFICSTTGVVDSLIVAAADQVGKSLENGTYERLLARGLITEDNIAAARKTLARYRRYHVVLSAPSPCTAVVNPG